MKVSKSTTVALAVFALVVSGTSQAASATTSAHTKRIIKPRTLASVTNVSEASVSSIPNPPANVPATPNFQADCWSANTNLTQQQCDAETLQAINFARSQEGVKPMVLPSNYYALTPQERQFVLVNLERVDRGLAPIPYLSNHLDADAQRAIQGDGDTDPWSNSVNGYASIAEDGYTTQLGSLYGYMYDDGWGGSAQNTTNYDCTSATASGCWGHRENILETYLPGPIAMGAGYAVANQPWSATSIAGKAILSTAIIADYNGPTSDVVMSWSSELPYFSSTSPGGNSTPTDTPAPYGSVTQPLAKPIVGMASTPDGKGYWLVAADGGIFTFGDAGFHGSTGNINLNRPIVGMASTPDGQGYWLVASDGGIFTFGDATFYGSTGAIKLNKPIVGMASTPDGKGYWLVASDGGIFTFGDATFYGSTGNIKLNQPIVGMASTPDGKGYWLVAADGGIFTFGDATFYGSAATAGIVATGIIASPSGKGYSIVSSTGQQFTFGDATKVSSAVANQPLVGVSQSASGGFYGVTSSGSVVVG